MKRLEKVSPRCLNKSESSLPLPERSVSFSNDGTSVEATYGHTKSKETRVEATGDIIHRRQPLTSKTDAKCDVNLVLVFGYPKLISGVGMGVGVILGVIRGVVVIVGVGILRKLTLSAVW